MFPRLSRSEKLEYMASARDEVARAYAEQGSYQDELGFILQTYGYGLGRGITVTAFTHFLDGLPLRQRDRMLRAFVGKQLLCETEEVLLGRARQYDEVNNSAFDNGLGDERDLDADVVKEAREEDVRLRGINGRIATQADIAASAMDGADLSWLAGDAEQKISRALRGNPPPPIVLLTTGIANRCRNAMQPLTWGMCPNSVRRAMHERIVRLRCLALQLSTDADDDECLSR